MITITDDLKETKRNKIVDMFITSMVAAGTFVVAVVAFIRSIFVRHDVEIRELRKENTEEHTALRKEMKENHKEIMTILLK